MIKKELRCNNVRDFKLCNQKLLEYEGELNNTKIFPYCRKCKKEIEVIDGKIKK